MLKQSLKKPSKKYRYVGCTLPSGNADEIPGIIAELIKTGVRFDMHFKSATFLIKIDKKDVSKLPVYRKEPYLPTGFEGGHGVYRFTPFLEEFWGDIFQTPSK